jgi:hypothetical protein
MKAPFSPNLLPEKAFLLTCSSHEERCRGLLAQLGAWRPIETVIFHYDDENPRREENHKFMEETLRTLGVNTSGLKFTEANAVKSLLDNMARLHELLASRKDASIVLDISVFTKRHLLMMLRWLDDESYWDRLTVVYSEPEDYDVSQYIPLSFGLASLQQIPGFSACPDLSRPVHLVLFLGYEGDRALAVYEHVQPMQTTLLIPFPPFKPSWIGRTEKFNSDLLAVVGAELTVNVDSIDPDATYAALEGILGDRMKRGQHAKIVCPLGTKPQTLGIYSYVRNCIDPPAVLYASPLRHNHEFFSHGVGKSWILRRTP